MEQAKSIADLERQLGQQNSTTTSKPTSSDGLAGRQRLRGIVASSTWQWHGYDNAWIDLDGQKMQASTGGGH